LVEGEDEDEAAIATTSIRKDEMPQPKAKGATMIPASRAEAMKTRHMPRAKGTRRSLMKRFMVVVQLVVVEHQKKAITDSSETGC